MRERAAKVGELARAAQSGARRAGQSAVGAAKRHPIPATLAGVGAVCTGVGVAWMLMDQRRGMAGEATEGGGAASEIAARAGRGAQQLAKRAQSRVRETARDARAESQLIGETAQRKFREHPLVVGAAMVAVGTAIGAALPSTVREGRWLGRPRDAVIGRARQAALGAARRVESLAKAPPA